MRLWCRIWFDGTSRVQAEWLLTGSVTQLVLAIISKDTRLPLERWVFDVNLVEPPVDSAEPYVHPVYARVS